VSIFNMSEGLEKMANEKFLNLLSSSEVMVLSYK
jgi:hypothetical protein